MIRIGIDPGKQGFICVYHEITDEGGTESYFTYYPMPLINTEVDLQLLYQTLASFNRDDDGAAFCVLESVHALFGASAKSTFNFGWVLGAIEGILVANEIPYVKVTPKSWQSEMLTGIPVIKKAGKTSTDTKAMSLLAAKRLFPNEDLRATERCKKPSTDKVDALLLAEYCRRHF